jgi:hypothetical protein
MFSCLSRGLAKRSWRLARRVSSVLRTGGVRELWWRALGITFYRRLTCFVLRMEQPIPEPAAHQPLSFSWLGEIDADAYLRLRDDQTADLVRARLARGDRCLIARMNGGDLVAVRWIVTGVAPIDYLGLAFKLSPGAAYVYDVFTGQSDRGQNIAAAMSCEMVRRLRSEGWSSVVATVLPENLAGQRLTRGRGYDEVGRVGCFRLGPWRIPIRRIPAGYLGSAMALERSGPVPGLAAGAARMWSG